MTTHDENTAMPGMGGIVAHNGKRYRLDDLAANMDDEQRDSVHLNAAPCTPQEFWDTFVARFPASADHLAGITPPTEGA
jgi:hypothetical protein